MKQLLCQYDFTELEKRKIDVHSLFLSPPVVYYFENIMDFIEGRETKRSFDQYMFGIASRIWNNLYRLFKEYGEITKPEKTLKVIGINVDSGSVQVVCLPEDETLWKPPFYPKEIVFGKIFVKTGAKTFYSLRLKGRGAVTPPKKYYIKVLSSLIRAVAVKK